MLATTRIRLGPASILLGLSLALARAPTLGAVIIYVDDDAPNDPGPGNPLVSDPDENGSPEHPFDALQEGITAAQEGDTVLVGNGYYRGMGNMNLYLDKTLTLRSAQGASQCVIDCQSMGRGLWIVGDAIVEGFTILNGLADGTIGGGGIYCEYGSPTIARCTISANQAPDCDDGGGGILCSAATPQITRCRITGNSTNAHGGGVCADNDSHPVLTDCVISGNSGDVTGGVAVIGPTGATLRGCVVLDNQSNLAGGLGGAGFMVRSCTIAGNTGFWAGGIYIVGDITLIGSTVSRNNGVGINIWEAVGSEIRNCIFWGNSGEITAGGVLVVSYSDIQGGWGGGGGNNIVEDPLFVAPLSGDYHLSPGSPCIDAGDPDFAPEPGETDVDGELRVWDGDGDGLARVEMGSDELGGPGGAPRRGDTNCDGAVDFDDINPFVAALVSRENYEALYPWCIWFTGDVDGNGSVDFDDINPFVACLVAGRCP
jgi:hypothetical protein